MNEAQAPSFLKGGSPLITIKYPPPLLLSSQTVVLPTRISPPLPLTFDPKTVSFKVQISHTGRKNE